MRLWDQATFLLKIYGLILTKLVRTLYTLPSQVRLSAIQVENKINGVPDSLTEELIKSIIAHKPVKKIVVYGSRATDNYRKTSDIDIAIVDESWDSGDISLVHFNLEEELSTPLTIDLVSFYNVYKESMQDAINKGLVLYESK